MGSCVGLEVSSYQVALHPHKEVTLNKGLGRLLDGERVLLTGGSGTLGRALLLCARKGDWKAQFTVFARSESRLARLKRAFPEVTCCIGDVRDFRSVQSAVAGHDTVIHMAAMKRIPECEQQPEECIAVNIQGTANVLRACANASVEDCTIISTDKACQAATTYGASKLITEGLMASYALTYRHVKYHGVRYGNVMASNGSVVQLWHEQASQGHPLTITDPDMTRFWMSPFDAAHLVVYAREFSSGVICVPRMSSLRMGDMASMLYPDSPVQVVGVRSNEKKHEDLVHIGEPATPDRDHILICTNSQPRWKGGVQYSSENAPPVEMDELLRMVREAGEVDRCA